MTRLLPTRIFPLLAILLAFATGSAASGEVGADGSVIEVCTPLDYPPYSYLDEHGEPVGYNVDLTRAIARVMKLNVEITERPFGEIRHDLEQGRIDAIAGMYYSASRDQSVDFTRAFTTTHHAIFIREGSPPIETEEDLWGKEIIVMRGDIMHDYVLANGLSENPVTVETQAEALRMLARGEHDCALIAKLPGYFWLNELNLTGLTTIGPLLNPSYYCFAVREGDAQLKDKLTEGLAILISTGQEQVIYDKWLGSLEPKGIPRATVLRGVLLIGGPVLVLLVSALLGAFWLRRLVALRTRDLRDRTKKLECVYNVAETSIILETVEEILLRVVELIPAGWQYPELARARVIFDGKIYCSKGFSSTDWFQSCKIVQEDQKRGSVEVHYLEECAFLQAEQDLLTTISHLLSKTIHEKQVEGRFLLEKASYQRLFHEMLNGFAVHRIICDEKGKPVDYQFLDVNPAFERMTGLKVEDVVGRRVREVMPGIEDSWIQQYGKVALTGEPVSFQSYASDLDRNFEVAVFQPAPDQLAVLFDDITQRRKYEEALAIHRSRLQSLAYRLANTEELLRQEIAAGLHDSIGQDLAALKLRVDLMRRQKNEASAQDPVALAASLDDISGTLDQVVQEIWNLAFQLSPPGLYEAGLVPALEWLVKRFNDQNDIHFHLEIASRPPQLKKQVRGLLFQTVRELLVNAVKHASPREVRIDLSLAGDIFVLVVADDGKGFNVQAGLASTESSAGFGLFSIRERLAFLGGSLDVDSAPGTGTRAVIRFHLKTEQMLEVGSE